MKKIIVIDNIIPKEQQENLKTLFFKNKSFPWYFVNDVSKVDNKKQRRPAFNHKFFEDNKEISNVNKFINQIAVNTAKKIKLKDFKIIQSRSFLQLPLNKEYIGTGVDTPHLDRTTPHIVFLYYVAGSDGDTVIYNYKSRDENDIPYFEDIKELKRITPKQGRVVIFDGMYWHTAEQPTKDVRCIINFNIANGNNDI